MVYGAGNDLRPLQASCICVMRLHHELMCEPIGLISLSALWNLYCLHLALCMDTVFINSHRSHSRLLWLETAFVDPMFCIGSISVTSPPPLSSKAKPIGSFTPSCTNLSQSSFQDETSVINGWVQFVHNAHQALPNAMACSRSQCAIAAMVAYDAGSVTECEQLEAWARQKNHIRCHKINVLSFIISMRHFMNIPYS